MRDDIVLDDRAVYLPPHDLLVLADLHLGRLIRDSVYDVYPVAEYERLRTRLTKLLTTHCPETVVFAGDVFQRASTPPDEAIQFLRDCHDIVTETGATLIITPGNHDTDQFDIRAYFDGPLFTEYTVTGSETISIGHGHHKPMETADLYVMGHLHPVMMHPERDVEEPCYLFGAGTYAESDVLVVPAFSPFVHGYPLQKMVDSTVIPAPLFREGVSIEHFRPYLWESRTAMTNRLGCIANLEDPFQSRSPSASEVDTP